MRKSPLPALLLLGLLAGVSAGAAPPGRLPADLALLPEGTAGLVSLRPAGLAGHPAADVLRLVTGPTLLSAGEEALLGVPLAAVERATLFAVTADHPALVVRTRKPYDRARLLRALGENAEQRVIRGRTVHATRGGHAVWLAGPDVFVVCQEGSLGGLTAVLAGGNRGPAALAEVTRLAAGGRHALVAGVVVGEAVRALADDLLRDADLGPVGRRLPADKLTRDWVLARLPVALLPYKPLMLARTATLLAGPGDPLGVELRVSFAGAAAAADGEVALRTARYVGREALPLLTGRLRERFPEASSALAGAGRSALAEARVARAGAGVTLAGRVRLSGPARPQVLAALRQRALEARAKADLHELLIAMHNYHDATGTFPPAALYGTDGKPALSWRVLLLPYLPGGDKLYKEFRLDQPWDSPHNKKLLPRMPRFFAPVAGKPKAPHSTFYRVFTGLNTPFLRHRGPRMAAFSDGLSNTFLIVEAAEAVPWTRPDELVVEPRKPLPKLGAQFPGVFVASFADGSTRLVRRKAAEGLLRLLIDPADGQPIPGGFEAD